MPTIPIEVSARHVHLTPEDWADLFGAATMTSQRVLSQRPNFSAVERVSLRGPKGTLENVAIVGPARSYTQVELAMTDARALGITPPLRDSGSLTDAATITIIGPQGEVTRPAAIIQQRHVHLNPDEAIAFGLHEHQIISLHIPGPRGATLENVLVRIHQDYSSRLHLDTDEGNSLGVTAGMTAELLI